MATLNSTAVNVAIRTLGAELDSSISTIQWVLTGYLLMLVVVIPITGWAGERFGVRRVWTGGLLLFLAGAVLSSAAWSAPALVTFRLLQGIGAGMLLPSGQAILAQAAGPKRMGRAISLLGMPLLLGSVLGPAFGGLVISVAGWRWIFLVNLPLGLVALLLARRRLPSSPPRPERRLDLLGLVLLCGGGALLIFGMGDASSGGGFGGPRTLAGLVAGVVLLVLYVVHARRRGDRALMDISLFGRRDFAAGATTSLLIAIVRAGLLLLLPLYWQLVHETGPLATGLLQVPLTLGLGGALLVTGWVADRVGGGVIVPIGIVLALPGTIAFAQAGTQLSVTALTVALFLIGLGVGIGVQASMAAAYRTLSAGVLPSGVSAINMNLRLGAATGTAGMALVLQSAITARAPRLGEAALGPLSPEVRIQLRPVLEEAFGLAFWMAFVLLAAALVPALLLTCDRPVPDE